MNSGRLLLGLHNEMCRMIWHRMSKTENSREARRTRDEWLASGKPFGLDLREEDEGV